MKPIRPCLTSFPGREDTGHRLLNQDCGPLATCQDWDGGKTEKAGSMSPRSLSFVGGGKAEWADKKRNSECPVSCNGGPHMRNVREKD